jgi:hypothetical protein
MLDSGLRFLPPGKMPSTLYVLAEKRPGGKAVGGFDMVDTYAQPVKIWVVIVLGGGIIGGVIACLMQLELG